MTGHHVTFTVRGKDQDDLEQAALDRLQAYAGGPSVDPRYLSRCLGEGTIRAYPLMMMNGAIASWEAEVEVELL